MPVATRVERTIWPLASTNLSYSIRALHFGSLRRSKVRLAYEPKRNQRACNGRRRALLAVRTCLEKGWTVSFTLDGRAVARYK